MLKELTSAVDPVIRQRGRDYFLRGAARLERVTPTLILARVRGTSVYEVRLDLDDEGLGAACTCPYSTGGNGPCKHIWATLLQADAGGVLPGGMGSRFQAAPEPSLAPAPGRPKSPGLVAARTAPPPPRPAPTPAAPQPQPAWKRSLHQLRRELEIYQEPRSQAWPALRELFYVLDRSDALADEIPLRVGIRDRRANGTWGRTKFQRLYFADLSAVSDPRDAQILALLQNARNALSARPSYQDNYGVSAYYNLDGRTGSVLVPLMAATGRLRLAPLDPRGELTPLAWDEGPPWELCLDVRAVPESPSALVLEGSFRRGDEKLRLADARLVVAGGLVVTDTHAARLEDFGAAAWIPALRHRGEIPLPKGELDAWLATLMEFPTLPRIELPPEIAPERTHLEPQLQLQIVPAEGEYRAHLLWGRLGFGYGTAVVEESDARREILVAGARKLHVRNATAESGARDFLGTLGLRRPAYTPEDEAWFEFPRNRLGPVVRALCDAGWHVDAEGHAVRVARAFSMNVSSGIDWFELHGGAQFGDETVPLPRLLAALRRGEHMIRLGDGSSGVLPEEWLRRYLTLSEMGHVHEDHVRLQRSQVFLLDALAAQLPEASFDKIATKARAELHKFAGVRAVQEPKTFKGELREYQREGLGWFEFLEKFGLGGCLADDMGLGKTVQVLARLEARRAGAKRGPRPTSLLVVPRSLIFNWVEEANRFAPRLRILDHTGPERLPPGPHFGEFDVVLTTYGTLRRDIAALREFEFDHVVLDEAQAIKNWKSASAKAARLVRGRQRLALSGTPIENHLGELWSLFEFLNPSLLGKAAAFERSDSREDVARALRPLILRRTKEQVAKELPPKVEQTIHCEMEPAQRRIYDELRDYYRRELTQRIDRDGIGGAQIYVLEALLRLRQVACHPALVDPKHENLDCAKLDVLVPRLAEVVAEGHRALVFSQFTSFLALLKPRLDALGLEYEYLDGKTRDRGKIVERFQGGGGPPLFLISLKAGGLGLNLTAAEYVFLLDPWWNPAVEAQAIDRTHRIGQERQVFAFRLVARDTIEERVLELQRTKKALADSILGEENSLIRGLSRKDLELLLS